MNHALKRLDTEIQQLSLTDLSWLLERIAHYIRQQTLPRLTVQKSELEAMAADPAIRQEIHLINNEFAMTESDGLDG